MVFKCLFVWLGSQKIYLHFKIDCKLMSVLKLVKITDMIISFFSFRLLWPGLTVVLLLVPLGQDAWLHQPLGQRAEESQSQQAKQQRGLILH